MAKRIIPRLKTISPNGMQPNFNLLLQNYDFQKMIMNETANAVVDACRRNKKTADIFEINSTGYFISLGKKDFPIILDKMINFHESREEYEKCNELLKIKNSL